MRRPACYIQLQKHGIPSFCHILIGTIKLLHMGVFAVCFYILAMRSKGAMGPPRRQLGFKSDSAKPVNSSPYS